MQFEDIINALDIPTNAEDFSIVKKSVQLLCSHSSTEGFDESGLYTTFWIGDPEAYVRIQCNTVNEFEQSVKLSFQVLAISPTECICVLWEESLDLKVGNVVHLKSILGYDGYYYDNITVLKVECVDHSGARVGPLKKSPDL